jgi:hypothetical protein
VRILIEASDLPGSSCGPSPDQPGGYHRIHVGVQHRTRRDELLGLVPGDAVPPAVLGSAVELGLLVGRLGLTDHRGHPLCASVRPPLIEWSAAAPAGAEAAR